MNNKIKKGFSHPHLTSDISLKRNMSITEQEYKRFLIISKGLSPKSVKTYISRFKILDNWLNINNKSLNRNSIEEFLFEKKQTGQTNASVNTYIQAFKHIASCCKYHDKPDNFMDGIENLPKDNPVIIPLSKEEALKLLETTLEYKNRNGVICENLDSKYLTLTEFFLLTGCRFDEAASLKVENLDIDNERAYLTNTKNKNNRFIFYKGPIKERLRELVKNKAPIDFVFTNSKGNKIQNSDFDSNVKKRAKKAGITKVVSAHKLRHTFGTLYYTQTHDVMADSIFLGHKDMNVTRDTYVHLDTEGLQQSYNAYPLVSKYVPVRDVIHNLKKLIENQKLGTDNRFVIKVEFSDLEYSLSIKAIEA